MSIEPQAGSHDGNLATLLQQQESALLEGWLKEQLTGTNARKGLIKEAEAREQSKQFLAALQQAARMGQFTDISKPEWSNVRDLLSDLSRSRAAQGYSPAETALFVFSLKLPLLTLMQKQYGNDASAMMGEIRSATMLLDQLGLFTTEAYQKSREQVILRQQQEMLELSTPVVRLHDDILALPLIGTLDSARTQVVMESLLNRIVETGASMAIIDITGVPTVDTLVAQHLLKTVAAARLMGADCIISGIRPQIAQTIVHLGVDLGNVITKATMADAFALALKRQGMEIRRIPTGAHSRE